ncbi:ABC transporter ATP-binding protein [Halobacillus litoralis]|uniref:ABC transporter n=1 Tax=Halobacillus litoralis TaxID=45668 RepID=A0A410MBB9_9BACI|nr:ABC transporter ATP-binding protein [Halobacillus litoralis]QAS52044.1 ABC transporter [Halobacillus litoralis]
MKAIECKSLTKTYRRKKALSDFTVSIDENKIVGLVGRNGAGKTTFMKILAGLLKEQSGSVEVYGRRPFNDLFVSANTIYIDDEMNFPAPLTLKEILEEGRRFYHNWDHELAGRLFKYFGFHPKQRHNELSKGYESTFNMIIGLASRSPLTIFDEPTTGMDAAVRKDFYRALLKDYLAHPRTILLSTHHLEEMEDVLEEIVLIDKGELYWQMSMDELKEYSIGLAGKRDVLEPWVQNQEVFYTRETGVDDRYMVVENTFNEYERQQMQLAGIGLSAVSASDLCVYVTDEKGRKGGVDDVFDRSPDR